MVVARHGLGRGPLVLILLFVIAMLNGLLLRLLATVIVMVLTSCWQAVEIRFAGTLCLCAVISSVWDLVRYINGCLVKSMVTLLRSCLLTIAGVLVALKCRRTHALICLTGLLR